MTNKLAKQQAFKILLQNRLYSLTDYSDLRRIIESNQFTIIEYNKYTNSEYVSELIKKLRVENDIEHNDSFLYIKNHLKLLFINSNVPDEDKCSLLRHELGHICDPDLKNNDAIYSKIKKEEFASEFSCYIKNPGIIFKFYVFIIKKFKLLVSTILLMACVLVFSFILDSPIPQPKKSVTSPISTSENSNNTYYITSGGKKYHRKSCVIVKYRTNITECTLKEAVDSGYKPCLICILEE